MSCRLTPFFVSLFIVFLIVSCYHNVVNKDADYRKCGFVVVVYAGTENQPTKLVPSRPKLPDYFTATKRLAERRGRRTTLRSDGVVIGRRARSCDPFSATPPCHPGNSDLSEDGKDFWKFCCKFFWFSVWPNILAVS